MKKNFFIFISLLTIILFGSGCSIINNQENENLITYEFKVAKNYFVIDGTIENDLINIYVEKNIIDNYDELLKYTEYNNIPFQLKEKKYTFQNSIYIYKENYGKKIQINNENNFKIFITRTLINKEYSNLKINIVFNNSKYNEESNFVVPNNKYFNFKSSVSEDIPYLSNIIK